MFLPNYIGIIISHDIRIPSLTIQDDSWKVGPGPFFRGSIDVFAPHRIVEFIFVTCKLFILYIPGGCLGFQPSTGGTGMSRVPEVNGSMVRKLVISPTYK